MSRSDLPGGDDFPTMKASEWLKIVGAIADRWPHASLPESTVTQWGRDLADLPGVQVAAGLESLYRDGREFPPNAGQIRQRVAELAVAAPDWHEAHEALHRIARLEEWTIGDSHEEERDGVPVVIVDSEVRPRDDALAAAHPLVRAFYEAIGQAGVLAGTDGGNDEARLRQKWEAFVKRATRREAYRGIPAGGLRELEAIEAEPRQLGEAVKQITEGRRAA
jgi:hypothetical protein